MKPESGRLYFAKPQAALLGSESIHAASQRCGRGNSSVEDAAGTESHQRFETAPAALVAISTSDVHFIILLFSGGKRAWSLQAML